MGWGGGGASAGCGCSGRGGCAWGWWGGVGRGRGGGGSWAVKWGAHRQLPGEVVQGGRLPWPPLGATGCCWSSCPMNPTIPTQDRNTPTTPFTNPTPWRPRHTKPVVSQGTPTCTMWQACSSLCLACLPLGHSTSPTSPSPPRPGPPTRTQPTRACAANQARHHTCAATRALLYDSRTADVQRQLLLPLR